MINNSFIKPKGVSKSKKRKRAKFKGGKGYYGDDSNKHLSILLGKINEEDRKATAHPAVIRMMARRKMLFINEKGIFAKKRFVVPVVTIATLSQEIKPFDVSYVIAALNSMNNE